MLRKFGLVLFGIVVGLGVGWSIVYYKLTPETIVPARKPQVIGFLPYWLLSKAENDYSKYLTTLAYFGVTIHQDGRVQKLVTEQETEPGWLALKSGRVDEQLSHAKAAGQTLSLVAFNGDKEAIDRLMDDPIRHAQNFIRDVAPIMRQYGFTDLNIDIESISDATPEGRLRFARFIKTVREGIDTHKLGTLSIDVTTNSFIKTDTNLIDPKKISAYIDQFIIMAYDYHYTGSYVSGAVAPLEGAGITAELDTTVVVQKASHMVPPEKLILGIPLYGYEWETLAPSPKSAIVPGTGLVISSRRAAEFLASCASCSAQLDSVAQESYIVYKDMGTGTYHQVFYPTELSSEKKIELVNKTKIGGVALWALGYEDGTILRPFSSFRR